ncbi:MAG TPA: hypothetical protein VHD87_05015 [Acidimicrobiales bacterium]|nr:hypothetical protein [Acidimicrobiales bacterium]
MTRFLPESRLTDPHGWGVRAGVIAGSAFLVFVISAGRLIPPTVGIGVIVMLMVGALAFRSTQTVVVLGLIAVALIPVYWGPVIPHTHIGVLPVLGVCLILLPRAWSEWARLRLTTIDWLMAGYVAMRIVGSLVNSSRGAGGALDAVLYAALPYTVFRLLGMDANIRRAAAWAVVIGGVAASVFAIREYDGGGNPFFRLFRNGYQHSYWIRVDFRFRHVRPEASFGHADALGLFLAFSVVLAIALAWHEKDVFKRALLYGGVLVCLQGIADTLERGPIILMLVAFPIILLVELRHGRSFRVVLAAVAALVVFAVTPFGAAALRLRDASVDQTNKYGLQASAQDRYDTIRDMTNPRFFTWLGHDQGDDPTLSVQQAIGLNTGLGAIENAFMWTYVVYGALAFLPFGLMIFPATRAAFSTRLNLIDRAWATIVVSSFVIFLSVGLASQFAHFFWIALGLTVAAMQDALAPLPAAVGPDARMLALRG